MRLRRRSDSARPADRHDTDLAVAWDRVLGLIEGAAAFGRHRLRGGEVVGWWPAKPPYDPLDSEFRVAWLRHELFTPLRTEELTELERLLGRKLPSSLRDFFATCSNGLRFAGGDLSIFGFRRGVEHDPWDLFVETVERPGDADEQQFFFGAWGGHRRLIYLDEPEGSVHVAASASVRPVRTWASFPAFLVDAAREHLSSFDAEGRRRGEAALPEDTEAATQPTPQPTPQPLPAIPSELAPSMKGLLTLLPRESTSVSTGASTYRVVAARELSDAQTGYRDETGGSWKPEWIVIGSDSELGDPLFIDLAAPELPVFTAEHGKGGWKPTLVAPSLSDLLHGD